MPAKGDGVSKRADARYMARYTAQTADGTKRKTIYGRKYKDVEKKLNEARTPTAALHLERIRVREGSPPCPASRLA